MSARTVAVRSTVVVAECDTFSGPTGGPRGTIVGKSTFGGGWTTSGAVVCEPFRILTSGENEKADKQQVEL